MNIENQQIASLRTYKGKEIYHLDYSNKKTVNDLVESIKIAREFRKQIIESSGKKGVLILVDLSNSFVFAEGLDELKQSGKELQVITRKRAVVGLNASKKILLNAVNIFAKTDFKAFDSVEDAQEWLIK